MLSVGKLLKDARERKKLSLRDVEKRIKVREQFIRALEEDRWNTFTSRIYVTGIMKNYARFLELDERKILAFFRREYERIEDIKFKEKVSSSYLSSDSKKSIIAGFVIAFALLIGYFSYQLFLFLKPPAIHIISPQTSVFKRERTIKIIGKTDKEAVITIMGERIYQNKEGVFEYVMPLKQKINPISIEVIGANGKKTVLDKTFTKTQ
ncbi:MAG: helix-turn-helix domain-containing protein [Candidatus Roizmanbacteria bacterium]|nr:helix-turn-helix domain-containing protein [Candidatus Roizmanbacteria bacterium]